MSKNTTQNRHTSKFESTDKEVTDMSENNLLNDDAPNFETTGKEIAINKVILKVRPTVDIEEAKDSYALSLDMPGIDPQNIEVHLNNEILSIEAKCEIDGLMPRLYTRKFRVMRGLDADSISARYHNGVLALRLAKPSRVAPQQIKINA
ncbi:MAG: Hsp20/alpha crystallin family protein [Proteobacteria bacterium]|nr:Hsp20/alpha crystallin family protein [Pseudomonadota bacterium]